MPSLVRSFAIPCAGSLVLALWLATPARSEEAGSVRAGNIEFVFASPEQGRTLLSDRDAYVQRLSPFDRQARRQSAQPVDEAEYLEFVRGEVREWEADEQARISAVLRSLNRPLSTFSLPPIAEIQLIHTTGREESGAAYTRGTAIVLPASRLRSSNEPQLRTLLAHELFHIISRYDSELRDQLYGLIGFAASNEIELPNSLADRRITNPDAPIIEHVLQLKIADEKTASVAPVLYAKGAYDPDVQSSVFAYLDFQLMEVEQDENGRFKAVLRSGQPVFHSPSEPDFARQIGRNTSYIIHPEEVLADNFAMLVTGKTSVPDPWILDGLRTSFTP